MKISREWLQTYFSAGGGSTSGGEKPLPPADEIARALTFHAFEVESVENDILDVKVTPNRGHDCLCHRGIAKEVAAILNIPLTPSLNAAWNQIQQFTMEMPITVTIEDSALCPRYIAWAIRGVKVGPTPKWLVDRLAAMGQQSINNIVDAANFVMFDIGQPLHVFDAGKLKKTNTGYAIEIRKAVRGEKLRALDEKEYELKDSMLVIVDENVHVPIGIAGVKGGMPAGISEETTGIIIESANFDGASVRKTAQALKLRTDASTRFEQVISPELAAEGMRAAAKLIIELAGGSLAGFADQYPKPQEKKMVSISLAKINAVLGTSLTIADVKDVFMRLFEFHCQGDALTIEVPPERLDIVISEDLVEEVGRIVGYDKIPSVELPRASAWPEINLDFATAEKLREELAKRGYSEVFTSVFADSGERAVANKVDGARPYLRTTLVNGLKEAYEKNTRNCDLLGLDEVRLFEIGTIWKGGKEEMALGTVDKDGTREEIIRPVSAKKYDDLSIPETERYQPFSKYPYIVRDIALWVPAETKPEEILDVIRHHAGSLLVRSAKFDEFKKGDKISYAFRLVFQSFDRTLFDGDANERMESVYAAVKEKGWEVR